MLIFLLDKSFIKPLPSVESPIILLPENVIVLTDLHKDDLSESWSQISKPAFFNGRVIFKPQ